MLSWAWTILLLQDPEPPDEIRVRWLVQELASDSFKQREKATEELMGMGKTVLRELNDALQKAKDPAVRKSIESLQQFLGAAEKVTLERLQTGRLNFAAEDVTFESAMKDLMTRSKIPIELAVDDPDSIPMPNVSFKDAPVEQIFNAVAKALDLQWKIKADRKVVFFRAGGMDAPGLILELYDIRHLCTPIRDHVIPLESVKDPADGMGDVPPEPRTWFHPDDLVQLIRDTVATASWDEEGRSICDQSGILVVRTTADVHSQIVKHLKRMRQELMAQVKTEILAVAHSPSFMAEDLSKAPRTLSEGQFDSIRNAALEGKDAALIGIIEMTGYKGQQVAGCHGSERLLIMGYDDDGTPRTEVGYEGLRIMVRPTLGESRQAVNVRVEGVITKILSVEKVKTEHGDVQVPKLYRAPIRQSPTIEASKPTVLLQSGSLEGFGAGNTQLLIVIRSTLISEK